MPVPVKGNNGFSSGMTTRNENNSTFIQGVCYLVVYLCKDNFSRKNKSQMNDKISHSRFRFREKKKKKIDFENLTGVIVVSFDLTEFCPCFYLCL